MVSDFHCLQRQRTTGEALVHWTLVITSVNTCIFLIACYHMRLTTWRELFTRWALRSEVHGTFMICFCGQATSSSAFLHIFCSVDSDTFSILHCSHPTLSPCWLVVSLEMLVLDRVLVTTDVWIDGCGLGFLYYWTLLEYIKCHFLPVLMPNNETGEMFLLILALVIFDDFHSWY